MTLDERDGDYLTEGWRSATFLKKNEFAKGRPRLRLIVSEWGFRE